jgi:hypothetical protein
MGRWLGGLKPTLRVSESALLPCRGRVRQKNLTMGFAKTPQRGGMFGNSGICVAQRSRGEV